MHPNFTKHLVFLSILLSLFVFEAKAVKGLYVNDFKNIVGDVAEENALLAYAQSNGFDYLLLYNLYFIHHNNFDITDPASAQPLADFIEKAKTMYGVKEVAAVGEKFSSFDIIHDYNLDHATNHNQQFDVYNIEFEFWNDNLTDPGEYYCTTYLTGAGLTCDTAGAFDYYIDQMCRLDSLCDTYDYLNSETYIGYPTAGQSRLLADCTDRVLVHYYRSSDVYNNGNSIYNYNAYRLADLAESMEQSVIMPIFNCKESFMGEWLDSVPETQAFDTWMNGLNGYNSTSGDWKENTQVDGYVWFYQSCMRTHDSISTTVKLQQIGELKLFPNPASSFITLTTNSNYQLKIEDLEIYNLLGERVNFELPKSTTDQTHFRIDTQNWMNGVYFVQWRDKTIRFLKN